MQLFDQCISPKFGSLSSVLLQWGAAPLSRFSMDAVVRAWGSLRRSGFSKYDLVRSEFDSPLSLAKLFDTKLECMNVVSGLHGDDEKANSVLGDAALLFERSENSTDLFAVLEREDRERVKRRRLLSPPRVDASDIYTELSGMDAKLQSRVSKSFFRSQLKNPLSSKTELEAAARESWLTELVSYLKESDQSDLVWHKH